MKKFGFIAVVLVGVMSMALTACAELKPFGSGKWRYKMTVTIETPEGDKTGYAVREVSASSGGIALPESHGSVSLKGEAVVIDLGQRGVVFALLSGYYLGADYGTDIPAYAFEQGGWLSSAGIKQMENLKAGPKVLELKWYPQFVRFRYLNDPKTVENLLDTTRCPDPVTAIPRQNLCLEKDRFEEAFGAGVKLKSVTIEMTEEAVNFGIERYLPWLPARNNVAGTIGGSPDKPFVDPTGTWLTGAEFSVGRFW